MMLGDAEDHQAGPVCDPVSAAEQRESLAQLVADLRRLPDQQRSALLMRELSGMSYSELADALELSVPAVKSLLVRARVNLTQALEARETACWQIREDLIDCHDRGVRATATARRHLRDCAPCREFRGELRGLSSQFSALVPGAGAVGLLAKLLGLGGGGGGGSAAAGGAAGGGAVSTGTAAVAGGTAAVAGGTAAVAGGAFGGGGALTAGGFLSGTHLTALIAAVITAGSAVAVQPALSGSATRGVHAQHAGARVATRAGTGPATSAAGGSGAGGAPSSAIAQQAAGGARQGTSLGGIGSTGSLRSAASSVSSAASATAAATLSVGLSATQTLSGVGATGDFGASAGTPAAASPAHEHRTERDREPRRDRWGGDSIRVNRVGRLDRDGHGHRQDDRTRVRHGIRQGERNRHLHDRGDR